MGPDAPELAASVSSPPGSLPEAGPGDPSPVAVVTPSAGPAAADRATVKLLLAQSARRHGLNPYLVMGVAWWESGWDQSRVSATGAIGIMQVEPATAATAGPLLLHRNADVHLPADNIELGAAVLRQDLDHFHDDVARALIAYYAGPAAVTDWNHEDADAQRYVLGVYRLAVAFSDGTGPA